eukprot:c10366_g1_i5.p1 GENE.c10366_g1_i5~~c10366_g1_i5.p1  ORF type:complete len:277 (-),score=65.74 c10366_g1_i5:194-1024(-)
MKKLIQSHAVSGSSPLEAGNQTLAHQIVTCPVRQRIDGSFGHVMAQVWRDPAIQNVLQMDVSRHESYKHLLDRVEVLASSEYVPTPDDVGHSAALSQSVMEQLITVQHNTLRLVDIGGQRGERRKWLHHFSSAQMLVFVADVNAYNRSGLGTGAESDDDKPLSNRMVETLELYRSVVAEPDLQNVPVVVLLNNISEFRSSFADTLENFSSTFTAYSGTVDADQGIAHVTKCFEEASVNKRLSAGGRERTILVHTTDSSNQDNVESVFVSLSAAIHK